MEKITIAILFFIFASCGCFSNKNDLLLIDACARNNIKEVEKLLDLGADINFVNKAGNTPLSITSLLGYYELFTLLLEKGADPNKQKNSLIIEGPITMSSSLERVKQSNLKSFEKIDIEEFRKILLKGNHYKIIEYLASQIDTNVLNSKGYSPLEIALGDDNIIAAEILIKKGADPEKIKFRWENNLKEGDYRWAKALINLYLVTKNEKKILEMFAGDCEKRNGVACGILGSFYGSFINDYYKAANYYDKALESDPNNKERLIFSARYSTLTKNIDKADVRLNKSYAIDSNNFSVNYNLGWLFFLKNDRVNSDKYFAKAIEFYSERKESLDIGILEDVADLISVYPEKKNDIEDVKKKLLKLSDEKYSRLDINIGTE